jgi:uncharacterized tellurite resistance protein B-like protein
MPTSKIFQFLGLDLKSPEKESMDDLRSRISTKLGKLSQNEGVFIASFAGLLARVARADGNFDSAEVKQIEKVLGTLNTISKAEVEAIVEILYLEDQNWDFTEEHQFSVDLNETADLERRKEVVRALYQVASADENIDFDEEQEIARIAKALMLSQSDLIEVRKDFKAYRSVLKS